MWMCELTVEWARLCIQYHLDICTSKSVVLTCIIPVEEPSSEEKTKSKERTKALRLTSPCMDQRYKAMWKTRSHGEDQGHERKPTMGVDQVEVHPKEKRSPCRNPRVQVEPDPGMKMKQGWGQGNRPAVEPWWWVHGVRAQWARAEEARTHALFLLRVDRVVQLLVDLWEEGGTECRRPNRCAVSNIFKIMQRASRCRTCTSDVKRCRRTMRGNSWGWHTSHYHKKYRSCVSRCVHMSKMLECSILKRREYLDILG